MKYVGWAAAMIVAATGFLLFFAGEVLGYVSGFLWNGLKRGWNDAGALALTIHEKRKEVHRDQENG